MKRNLPNNITLRRKKTYTEGGLAIASYLANGNAPNDTDYVTAAKVQWSNAMKTADGKTTYGATLKPASFDATTGKWWTTTAATADKWQKADDAVYADADSNAYYLLTKWSIKSLDQSGTDYNLAIRNIDIDGSATAGTVDALLEKSLRVMVKVGTTYTKFAPNYETTVTSGYTYTDGTNATVADTVTPAKSTTAIDKVVGTVDNAGTTVEVYIYFEGTDPNCMSVNAQDLNELEFTITWAAIEQ